MITLELPTDVRRPRSLKRVVMPSRPKALDLYCCAGGAGTGLHRAGYDVSGVDIVNQPNYPFAFALGNALDADLSDFDFVWASPPCQNHSRMSGCREGLRDKYPSLIAATRAKLKAWGGPWIIENVVGAPLKKSGDALRGDVRAGDIPASNLREQYPARSADASQARQADEQGRPLETRNTHQRGWKLRSDGSGA